MTNEVKSSLATRPLPVSLKKFSAQPHWVPDRPSGSRPDREYCVNLINGVGSNGLSAERNLYKSSGTREHWRSTCRVAIPEFDAEDDVVVGDCIRTRTEEEAD